MRKPLSEEVSIRARIDAEVALAIKAGRISPPSYLAKKLIDVGLSVTRQLIARRYNELGIFWDVNSGLWLERKNHEKK